MFGASSGQITTTLKTRSLHGSSCKGMIKNIILQMHTYVDIIPIIHSMLLQFNLPFPNFV
jgi:hypothetical protein